ncbi:alcohol dehydrogenase catalytic domain-containing protein [Alphaproteobacteria bacterium]|nr:alcohol dehydrogenase catalytic domain-containing protein [Alphaproteobacteria bacterium]
MMKAAVINEYSDDYNVLKYQDVEIPVINSNEVLIKVHASGVNHCDTDLRRGLFGVESDMPHVMGVDASGEIVDLGSEVKHFKIGDRVTPHFILSCGYCSYCLDGKENICPNAGVLGVTTWGGYAEYLKIRENNLIKIPDSLSFEDAVAGQVPFATAWEALIEVANLRSGENVLITAAGGGVGSAAIQIAKFAGSRVIAAAGNDEKLLKAKKLGADEIINYSKTNIGDAVRYFTNGVGVEVALEMTGGSILLQSIDALALGGRMATIGAHGGEKVEIDFIELFRKHISIHGCGRSTKVQVKKVLDIMAKGHFKPIIHKTLNLSEASFAHEIMESRNFFGRMILKP